MALLLGSTFPALTAGVGYVPSGVGHASIGVLGGPSWTYQGEPVPYLFPPDAATRHEQVTAQEPPGTTRFFTLSAMPSFSARMAKSMYAPIPPPGGVVMFAISA